MKTWKWNGKVFPKGTMSQEENPETMFFAHSKSIPVSPLSFFPFFFIFLARKQFIKCSLCLSKKSLCWGGWEMGKKYFNENISASITFNTSNKAKGEISEKQSPVVEHHEESWEGQESSWGGGGQRRTGNVLVCEEKRQTRQRFSKNSLVCEIPAVETGWGQSVTCGRNG